MDKQRVELDIRKNPKKKAGSEEILTREQLIEKIKSYGKEEEFIVTFGFNTEGESTGNE